MQIKKWLCALLTLALLLSMLPGHVMAAETASEETILTGPAPAEGNYVRWIDRIADLPEYASDFYGWLEENANATGALADPTQGEYDADKDRYIHKVATITGDAPFTYTSTSDMNTNANQAAQAEIGDQPDIIMDYIFAAYRAFDQDHPEVFWLDGASKCGYSTSYSWTYGGGTGTIYYTVNVFFYLQASGFDLRAADYQDTAVIAAAIGERDSDVERILADCPTDTTVQEQIKYLNKALIETNAYNSAVASGNSAAASADAWKCVSALEGNAGVEGPVCEGYSRAFKVLCDELGIPCVLVEGDAKSSVSATAGAHMWNYVQVGSSWYAVDVTWNDPLNRSDMESIISGYEREDWLLLGSESIVNTDLTFIESHPVSNVLGSDGVSYANGPELAADAYVQPENLLNVSDYRSGESFTAPTKDGFIFAGWYTDESLTQPLSRDVTTGYAYAKFVDESVLTVKSQITKGTTAESEKTNLRLLTSVDALDYASVNFTVTIQGYSVQIPCTTVFETIRAGEETIENAAAIFGDDARYFVTYTLLNVYQSLYNTDITVTPSWETLDGTTVTGESRTIQISQGFSV